MVLKNTFIGQENKVDLLYSDAHYDLLEKMTIRWLSMRTRKWRKSITVKLS